MRLLNLLRRPTRSDPVFGDLVYRRRRWTGEVTLPQLHHDTIPVFIDAPKDAELAAFHAIFHRLGKHSDVIKREIAVAAFDTYTWYVKQDLSCGNYDEETLAEYPPVSSADEIWRVLTPFRLTVTDKERDYNSVISLDVNWPNDHYFVAYLNDLNLYLLDEDG